MKRLARLPGLKYTFYGVFCLFFSTFIAAATGFIYCITRGHFNSAPPEGAGFESFAYGMRYIFGVITVARGISLSTKTSTASSEISFEPDVATITGSTTMFSAL